MKKELTDKQKDIILGIITAGAILYLIAIITFFVVGWFTIKARREAESVNPPPISPEITETVFGNII